MDTHHIIPVAMFGDDYKDNKILLDRKTHEELHNTQNISYTKLREYRRKLNHILIPNEYVLDNRLGLRQKYFDGAVIEVGKQKEGLNKQVIRNKKLNRDTSKGNYEIQEALQEIINQQKYYIKKIVGK